MQPPATTPSSLKRRLEEPPTLVRKAQRPGRGRGTANTAGDGLRRELAAVADEWICPITRELPWNPVLAEDGRVYERDAIHRWLKRSESPRSPVSNAAMGRALVALPQVRNTVRILAESGAVDEDKTAHWELCRLEEWSAEQCRKALAACDAEQAPAGGGEQRALAMYLLSRWYQSGKSCLQRDEARAFEWCRRSADLGHVMSTARVGWMYLNGMGVRTNVARGSAYLGQAAARGSKMACWVLGEAHRLGKFDFGEDAQEAALYFAQIPTCSYNDLASKYAAEAAHWLRARTAR